MIDMFRSGNNDNNYEGREAAYNQLVDLDFD